jgi:hypothetical protein
MRDRIVSFEAAIVQSKVERPLAMRGMWFDVDGPSIETAVPSRSIARNDVRKRRPRTIVHSATYPRQQAELRGLKRKRLFFSRTSHESSGSPMMLPR